MEIKSFTNTDKNDWLILWQGYLAFYQTELSEVINDNTWQNLLNPDNNIYGFGAWVNGELVGIVQIILHPTTWNITECCYLNDLFVNKDVRGKGIGRKLIEHIYNFATSKNCNRVYWNTQENNYPARKLYDTLANKTDFIQYRKNLP